MHVFLSVLLFCFVFLGGVGGFFLIFNLKKKKKVESILEQYPNLYNLVVNESCKTENSKNIFGHMKDNNLAPNLNTVYSISNTFLHLIQNYVVWFHLFSNTHCLVKGNYTMEHTGTLTPSAIIGCLVSVL